MYTTRITAPTAYRVSGGAAGPITLTRVTTGLTGAPGSSGQAQISADADNQLTQGSDQRLYVPHAQAVADPLAYYILAKA